MNPAGIRTNLDNLLDVLMTLDIAVLRSPVISQGSSNWRTRVGHRANIIRSDSFSFGSIEEYKDAVRRFDFACVLIDGSLLQMAYEFQRSYLIGHRLAFMPCPCPIDEKILHELPILDAFDAQSTSIDNVLLRSPLRFDFNDSVSNEQHSRSHVHFNHTDCRLAVSSPLQPVEFVRFIIKNFFPPIWLSNSQLGNVSRNHLPRVINATEELEFHLACRNVASSA